MLEEKKAIAMKVKKEKERIKMKRTLSEKIFFRQIKQQYEEEKDQKLLEKEKNEQLIRELEMAESMMLDQLNETMNMEKQVNESIMIKMENDQSLDVS